MHLQVFTTYGEIDDYLEFDVQISSQVAHIVEEIAQVDG